MKINPQKFSPEREKPAIIDQRTFTGYKYYNGVRYKTYAQQLVSMYVSDIRLHDEEKRLKTIRRHLIHQEQVTTNQRKH